jgi:hypothetical protein
MARYCAERQRSLNERERDFVQSMLHARSEPSEKQERWLIDLYLKLGGAR